MLFGSAKAVGVPQAVNGPTYAHGHRHDQGVAPSTFRLISNFLQDS
jgi:hypothetical protein